MSARGPLVEQMLEQFPLDSAQGKALMGLAEALLRTPDPRRADQLIAERLATVRAARRCPATRALLLRTGFVLLGAAGRLLPDVTAQLAGEFTPANLAAPLVAPIVRAALRQSMQMHGSRVHRRRDASKRRSRAGARTGPGAVLLRRAGRGRAHRERTRSATSTAYAHAIAVLGTQAPRCDATRARASR